uniref:Uncharacterized protein n=1 Tax=Candidatus Kentrum sp. LPFa TaxID=2126335 RepID=A0A450WIE0_9GAMM|nr:MAG: hypothetical protein BECKLPF1236B_GA0070989_110214 [Candidatus Kentron sp. LPFa]
MKGKLRGQITAAADADRDEIEQAALVNVVVWKGSVGGNRGSLSPSSSQERQFRLPRHREREPHDPVRLPGLREGLTGLSADEPDRPPDEPGELACEPGYPESEREGRFRTLGVGYE